jgi:FkbM family methyltransferase
MILLSNNDISVVFDVGANSGQYGKMLRESGYRGRIVSFEPLTTAYKYLVNNARHDPNWQTVNVALGNFDGKTIINISANSWSSSLVDILPTHLKIFPDSVYVGREEITVRKLDSIISEYDVGKDNIYLKIDTQGYERKVLEGAESSLSNIIGVEVESSLIPLYQDELLLPEMLSFMNIRGYTLLSVDPALINPSTGQVLQIDCIFFVLPEAERNLLRKDKSEKKCRRSNPFAIMTANPPPDSPLISVITVSLNAEKFLEQTIRSVLGQTYPHIEYIIIDGGSTDGTVDIIRKYESRLAYWHSKPDRGLAHAFNLGLSHASGAWILFLNADDFLWEPTVIFQMAPYLIAHSTWDVVFGQTITMTREKWSIPSPFRKISGHTWCWQEFRRLFTLPHQSSFTNRNLFERIGIFNEKFPYAMDYELYLRRGKNLRAQFIPLTISGMREGGISGKRFIRSLSYSREAIILTGTFSRWLAWLNFFYLVGRYYFLGPAIRKFIMLFSPNIKFSDRNAHFGFMS